MKKNKRPTSKLFIVHHKGLLRIFSKSSRNFWIFFQKSMNRKKRQHLIIKLFRHLRAGFVLLNLEIINLESFSMLSTLNLNIRKVISIFYEGTYTKIYLKLEEVGEICIEEVKGIKRERGLES